MLVNRSKCVSEELKEMKKINKFFPKKFCKYFFDRFLRILSMKLTNSRNLKYRKIVFFYKFQNITHLLWLFILVNFLRILSTKAIISQKKNKTGK